MSSISAIPSSLLSATKAATTTGTTPAATTSSSSQTLTQQDFLKIMVAQFTQQDPLASGDGGSNSSGTSDYVNQLMSMTNLTTIQSMSSLEAQQLAQSLPGSTVGVTASDGTTSQGVVQSTRLDGPSVYVTVNGTEYPSSSVTSIQSTAAEAAAAASTTTSTTNP